MEIANNESMATLRQVRVSPQKLNLVVQTIRRKKAVRALDMLLFCKKRIAGDVRKTLKSAIANAQNNLGLDVNKLIVKDAFVGKSVRLRRFLPRGRGHNSVICKPFSNLTIVVKEEE